MSYSASDFYDDVMAATQKACTQVGIPLRPPGDDGGDLEDDAAAVMHTIRRLAGMVNRGAAIPATPTYEFEAVRYYGVGERYNTGAGLQFTTKSRREVYDALSAYAERAELYACEVRILAGDGTEGRAIARSGPPMTVAKVTSHRAYRERYPIAPRDERLRTTD